jgi:hypothetical protein
MMPYITIEYYLDEFIGTEVTDDRILQKAILRASEVIDVLTHYQMANETMAGYKALEDRPAFIQSQVKKATAALAEHYILNGGYDATRQINVSSANIGGFSFSANEINEVPETVLAYLSTTGLLYAGIHSPNKGEYYTGWWL